MSWKALPLCTTLSKKRKKILTKVCQRRPSFNRFHLQDLSSLCRILGNFIQSQTWTVQDVRFLQTHWRSLLPVFRFILLPKHRQHSILRRSFGRRWNCSDEEYFLLQCSTMSSQLSCQKRPVMSLECRRKSGGWGWGGGGGRDFIHDVNNVITNGIKWELN